MEAPVIDPTQLEAFVLRAMGDLSAGYGGVMVSLGATLGLYKAMAGAGPISTKELAVRTGCAKRYVSEWLNAQAAGGYVGYHAISDTYELSPEQAMVLADEDSPVFVPPAWQVPASMWFDEDKAIEAFRTGKGVAWGEHDGRLSCGVAAFYRNAYRAHIEILYDLSLGVLHDKHGFTNFVELQTAWQKTLDTSALNRRFYQELANWYF